MCPWTGSHTPDSSILYCILPVVYTFCQSPFKTNQSLCFFPMQAHPLCPKWGCWQTPGREEAHSSADGSQTVSVMSCVSFMPTELTWCFPWETPGLLRPLVTPEWYEFFFFSWSRAKAVAHNGDGFRGFSLCDPAAGKWECWRWFLHFIHLFTQVEQSYHSGRESQNQWVLG